MKTYVINMAKDIAKRKVIECQLQKHPELDYEICKAVEGRKLTHEEQHQFISPMFKQRYGKSASLPAAGCALSHINVYKSILESDIDYALILEDDAILSDDLKLDCVKPLLFTDNPVAILLTSDFWYINSPVLNIDKRHTVFKAYDGYMTSGYLINKAAARLLLDKIYPVQYTADAWANFISFGIKLYGVVPHIVSFPDEPGEIGQSIIPTGFIQEIRSKLIKIYITIKFIPSYLLGKRKSKKKWR